MMSDEQRQEKPSSDEVMQQKRCKAERYATQPQRFCVLAITLRLQSEHGLRQVSFDGKYWHCTCLFFREHQTCSHTMAAEQLLEGLSLSTTQEDEHATL